MWLKKRSLLNFLLGLFIWLFVATPTVNPLQTSHTLLATPEWAGQDESGVELWHDYGAFSLYRISADQSVQELRQQSTDDVYLLEGSHQLYVGTTQIDTRPFPHQKAQEATAVTSPNPSLHLIQFVGPIKQEWLTAVADTGAKPIHYVANHGYVVWATAESRARLQQLAQDGHFIQYSGAYLPAYKVDTALHTNYVTPVDNMVTVSVQMFRHDQQAQSEATIQSYNLLIPSVQWTSILNFQNGTVTVRQEDVQAIAQLPDVIWVEPYHQMEKLDEIQAQILAGTFNDSQTGPSSPSYLAWLDSLGFSQNPNDYPIIDIVDDGVGNGFINSGDYTLHQFGDLGEPSRVAYIINCSADESGGGVDGHGHLSANISVGYDDRTGFPYQDDNGYQLGLGINPYGRMASTKIFNSDGFFDVSNCQNSTVEIARRTSESGAGISSNSWGCHLCSGVYDLFSQAYDTAVRDSQFQLGGNQEMIYIFGAGNGGPDNATIYSPANGKNVIAVGASEGFRETFSDICVLEEYVDSAMDMAFFSSRGPAAGGRVKPEVVAPGTHIMGTASTHPDFNASAVCDYYPEDQTIFVTSNGTSHATPAVSGIAALYTYWLEKEHSITPSPAMMKAYLIAHPTYLTGHDANDTLPSHHQGYGLPNMRLGFDDSSRYLVDQTTVFYNSGESWTFSSSVADPTKPVRITMAYTDQPGMIGVQPQVNDLTLSITLNGQTYWGNHFNGQWSAVGGAPDTLNNYEAIFLPAGTTGDFEVTITAFNIAGNGVPNYGDETDQDFAFVCYNCAQQPDFTVTAVPADQAVCQTSTQHSYAINTTAFGNFNQPISLALQNLPAGASAAFSPNTVAPNETSQLSLNLNNVPAGHYKMTISGTAANQSATNHLWLHLADSSPAPITLTSPPDRAFDAVVNPLFEWEATVTGEQAYTVQVATDPSFNAVAYEATTHQKSHQFDSSLTTLQTDTLYYWRVLANNACGETISPAYQFQTADTRPILLVDDDFSGTMSTVGLGKDVAIAYGTALNHQGTYYDFWNTEAMLEEPDFDTLKQYDAVIWFSGDAYNFLGIGNPLAGPSEAGETALASYLDNGRCLLLSSQEYFYDRGEVTPFMSNYLGIDRIEDDAGATSLTGLPPLFDFLGTFAIDGAPRFGLADPDIVYPNETAVAAFAREDGKPIGIYREADYQTLYLGFDLYDVDHMPRMLTIDRFLSWCQTTHEFIPPGGESPTIYLPFINKP